MGITTIIDADSIILAAATTSKTENELYNKISEKIKCIKLATFCDNSIIFLRHRDNFRKEVYKGYKSNRKSFDDIVRKFRTKGDYFLLNQGARNKNTYEADDLCLIEKNRIDKEEQNILPIIAGIDKDLLTCDGIHYNYNKRSYLTINKDDADLLFWEQMLKGDSGDGVPGLPKIGDVNAKRILKNSKYGTRHIIVLNKYRELLNEEMFFTFGACLYILRDFNISFVDYFRSLDSG